MNRVASQFQSDQPKQLIARVAKREREREKRYEQEGGGGGGDGEDNKTFGEIKQIKRYIHVICSAA